MITKTIQLVLTAYIFIDTYFVNQNVSDDKFGYFIYVSFLSLQIFPISLIIIIVLKILIAYFKKKSDTGKS
jgi:hypothetical protein